MPELTLESATNEPQVSTNIRKRDSIESWQQEILEYYSVIRDFHQMEPDQVFSSLSALSARASEMRTMLVRNETRRAAAFRTREIDPFLEECDRQFKLHSRIQAIREFDLRMVGNV
jgi:hypothetical protein